ncbi:MAG TPA: hypothetical protein VNE71_03550, partial [Myxococcota bacterium]|nr:hypothetical protein [Myxococcota bacterium]
PPPAEAAAAEPARLDVNAIPWAEVRVDGRAVGETPIFELRLAPGPHVIDLRNSPLGVERRMSVDLAPGESRALVVELR